MRLALLILFLATTGLRAAVGDVFGMSIDPQGWFAHIWINGLSTNGTFAYGLGTNNSITGAEKLVITLTSQGYDDTGALITRPRTVYGTFRVRFPYPGEAYPDTVVDPDGLHVKIALSDFIYAADSNLVATVGAGLYTGGSANNAAASVTVTNTSTLPYAKVIANRSFPGDQAITNSTMTLRAVAFHRDGQPHRPIRVMRFVARDQSGNAVTNFVTAPTIDTRMPDAVPVAEYVSDMDISTLMQGEFIRCDFTAYPWVGDSTSIQDTMDGVNLTGPNYGPWTNWCNRTLADGGSYAIVSPTGVDASGVVGSNIFNPTWVTPYLTIGRALDGLHRTNASWFGASRSNAANSIIFLTAGLHDYLGLSTFTGNRFPMPPPILTHWPTNTRAEAVLNKSINTTDAGKRFVLRDITIAFTNSGFATAMDLIWFDRCVVNTTSTAMLGAAITNGYFTHCLISNWPSGFNASQVSPSLIRGNWLHNTNIDFRLRTYTTIGNRRTKIMPSAGSQPFVQTSFAGAAPYPDRAICAFNAFYGVSVGGSQLFSFYDSNDSTNGGAFVGNIIENINTNQQALMMLGSVATNITNLVIWNNNLLGDGSIVAYNDTGTVPRWRVLWSVKDNLFDRYYIKADTFTTASANRTGNWAVVWGVGHSGVLNPGVLGHTPGFTNEFPGLNSVAASYNLSNWFRFTDRQSALIDQGVQYPGFGNYRLLSDSPALQFQSSSLLPFDLEGNNRGGFDPPGAYASASPRKGGGFF